MQDDSNKNSSTRDSEHGRIRSQSNLLSELQIEDPSNFNSTPLKIQKSQKQDTINFDTNEKIKVVAQSSEDINDIKENEET